MKNKKKKNYYNGWPPWLIIYTIIAVTMVGSILITGAYIVIGMNDGINVFPVTETNSVSAAEDDERGMAEANRINADDGTVLLWNLSCEPIGITQGSGGEFTFNVCGSDIYGRSVYLYINGEKIGEFIADDNQYYDNYTSYHITIKTENSEAGAYSCYAKCGNYSTDTISAYIYKTEFTDEEREVLEMLDNNLNALEARYQEELDNANEDYYTFIKSVLIDAVRKYVEEKGMTIAYVFDTDTEFTFRFTNGQIYNRKLQ